MIRIKRNEDNKDTMDIAAEYAALTLKLMQEYRPVWDRAMDYVERVMAEQ